VEEPLYDNAQARSRPFGIGWVVKRTEVGRGQRVHLITQRVGGSMSRSTYTDHPSPENLSKRAGSSGEFMLVRSIPIPTVEM
jgi:hypothetical protein